MDWPLPGRRDRRRWKAASARIRSVVLGPVREVSKRQAQRKLSEYLAAINQGTHKPEVMITFERFVLERFEPNILPDDPLLDCVGSIAPQVAGISLPFFGRMRMSEIGASGRANVFDRSIEASRTADGAVASKPTVKDILRPLFSGGTCSAIP